MASTVRDTPTVSFTEAAAKIVEGASAGLYGAGTIIMANSQILVPVDTGTLKRSGRVEEPVVSGDGDSVTVTVGYGYGGAYEGYAASQGPDEHQYGYWVHERVVTADGTVVKHKPPTQAKFLQVPAEAMVPEFPGILEDNINARLHT